MFNFKCARDVNVDWNALHCFLLLVVKFVRNFHGEKKRAEEEERRNSRNELFGRVETSQFWRKTIAQFSHFCSFVLNKNEKEKPFFTKCNVYIVQSKCDLTKGWVRFHLTAKWRRKNTEKFQIKWEIMNARKIKSNSFHRKWNVLCFMFFFFEWVWLRWMRSILLNLR